MTAGDTDLSIGGFSLLSGLSIPALRRYHESGLLRPTSVDPATGYRRYSTHQLSAARAIRLLRSVDLPLSEVVTYLDHPVEDNLRRLLQEHRGRLEARADEVAQLLTRTDHLLAKGFTMTDHVYSGKVRDIYAVDAETLLFLASDRLSAFDVVLKEPIPNKGRVLTAMTTFWLDQMQDIAPNHLVSVNPADFPTDASELPDVAGRAMLVRKAEMLPIECIVRGYLTGSAMKEYRASGTMHGETLPAGLEEASALPGPVFTPSTKADTGHDENISFSVACDLVGKDVAEEAREISLNAYRKGSALAAERGIIIADTKFELGFIDGKLSLCDEVLTPDSSRFWPADEWQPGKVTPSFDKQPVRDWLEASGWDKTPPPPSLPDDVVVATSARYATAYEKVTGLRFADWHGVSS